MAPFHTLVVVWAEHDIIVASKSPTLRKFSLNFPLEEFTKRMGIVVTTLKLFNLAHAFVFNETFGVEPSLVDSLLLRMLPFPNIMSGRSMI